MGPAVEEKSSSVATGVSVSVERWSDSKHMVSARNNDATLAAWKIRAGVQTSGISYYTNHWQAVLQLE